MDSDAKQYPVRVGFASLAPVLLYVSALCINHGADKSRDNGTIVQRRNVWSDLLCLLGFLPTTFLRHIMEKGKNNSPNCDLVAASLLYGLKARRPTANAPSWRHG